MRCVLKDSSVLGSDDAQLAASLVIAVQLVPRRGPARPPLALAHDLIVSFRTRLETIVRDIEPPITFPNFDGVSGGLHGSVREHQTHLGRPQVVAQNSGSRFL